MAASDLSPSPPPRSSASPSFSIINRDVTMTNVSHLFSKLFFQSLWQVQVPRSDESRDGLSSRSPRLETNGQDGKTNEVDAAAHDVPENIHLGNIPNLNRYLKISCTKNFQRSRIAASWSSSLGNIFVLVRFVLIRCPPRMVWILMN